MNTLTTATLTLIVGLLGGYYVGMQSVPQTMVHEMNMTGAMDSMTMGLEGKIGVELEKAFLTEMIVHHEGAVAMAQQLLKGTTRSELVTLGNGIITAQTKEITQMKRWLQTWFTY
jgi:uncharacterized protein (DUF305 family)